MADPKCSSISSIAEVNWFIQMENGISKKDLSKRDDRFCLFQIRPCGMTRKSGGNSSQSVNAAVCLSHSSFFKVVFALVVFLETDAW